MPAEGRILGRRRHGTVLPDCIQDRNWTQAEFVCDHGTGVSNNPSNTFPVMLEMSAMGTFPLCQAFNTPNCDHAASHQFLLRDPGDPNCLAD